MSHENPLRPSFPLSGRISKTQDALHHDDILPLKARTSIKEMSRNRGAPTLRSMALQQALEECDTRELSELSPVTLARVSKSMWATMKLLAQDANRWRLMRRRACLLDRKMLDGPYRTPPELERAHEKLAAADGLTPAERLMVAQDRVVAKWDVIPYADDLEGPDEKRDDVLDSADFCVDAGTGAGAGGTVSRVRADRRLLPGQRRWESEISAQLLLYRLCLLFQQGPMLDSGAWLFILRSASGAEIWFVDRGNFHWFLAVCPDAPAFDDVTELLELLISDRCVIRYDPTSEVDQPTAGETIGAAWSR